MTILQQQTSKDNGGMSTRRAQEAKIARSQTMERLAFRIEAGEVWTGWIKITPGMAQEIMAKYNPRNRPFRPSRAKKYARQMAAGKWRKVTDPFLFSKSGWLLNGQHRFDGCIMASFTMDAYCVFGEPDENFAFVDLAGGRSANDIFSIYGVKNIAHASSITRFIAGYKAGGTGRLRDIWFNFDNPDVAYQTYLDLGEEKIQKSVKIAHAIAGKHFWFPSVMGGLHFLFAEKSQKQANEFFDGLITGAVSNPKSNPIFKLRDHVMSDEKPLKISVAGDVIQTWNSWRTRKTIGRWYSTVGGKFPVIL